MDTDPDVDFFQNYFASYEVVKPSGSGSRRNLQFCNCALKCCVRFSPKIRLLLRAWYQRLTPDSRTAFLSSHLREASPGIIQYRLPATGTRDLVLVCKAHFMDTLQESKGGIVEVISAKRKVIVLEEDHEEDFEGFEEEELLPDRHNAKQQAARLDRIARGLSYKTKTNKLRPPRKVKAPCDSACKFQCYQRFPLADRQQRLKNLLQMPLVKQRTFLADLVCRIAVMPPRKTGIKSRLHNYYFFREGRQLHKVCKTMFLNTFDITRQAFSIVMKKKGSKGHIVCGNPEFFNVLSNLKTRRLVFDIDEGRSLEMIPVNHDSIKEEEILLEEVHDGIRYELDEIKSELDEADQAILPDNPPLSNTQKLVPDLSNTILNHEIEENTSQNIELPSLDIKSETDEPEAEDQQLVESDTGPDDSSTDSQQEVQSMEEELPSESNKRKHMRARKIRGLSYKTKSGNLWPARQVKTDIGTCCKFQCHTRVPDEVRKQLLADLLRLSLTKQRAFIGDHVCRISTIRPHFKSSRRQCTNFYFLPVDSQLVKVCREMFCSTYDLSGQQVRRILLKKGPNAHVVCGNPNFPSILKNGRYYFDYNAVCDVAEREMCKCHLKCSNKFSMEVIEAIRSNFQEKSTDEQYNFLSKYVHLMTGEKSPLLRTRFFLPLETTTQKVCRRMFLSTFEISLSFLYDLLNSVQPTVDSTEYATTHIASYQMDEEHHCEITGAVRKLSRCPNPVRMYNEYQEGLGPEAIGYLQYYGMFNDRYVQTGLMLPTKCPDCGFFDSGEGC